MSSPELTSEEVARLPHGERGPAILAVHWTLTALATIFLALRVYCKRLTNRRLWWDDWILIAAWVIILGTDALTTYLVIEFGLGRHSWALEIYDFSKFLILINARATFTLTSLGWSKTAFAITLLRLSSGMTRAFVWFLIISINITTIISAAVPWIQCVPVAKAWDGAIPGTCWAPMVGTKVWIGMGAYSALIDFTLAFLPWIYLYRIFLNRKEKIGILVAMSMGAIAGVVAIAKCVKLPILGTGNSYDEAELFILDVTESTVTVMAACIPTLRVLLRETGLSSSHNYQVSDRSYTSRHQGFQNIKVAHNVMELQSPCRGAANTCAI